jgi:hypothetical protein
MAWGFGPAGYASFRTTRILEQFDRAGALSVADRSDGLRAAAASGPASGFSFLAEHQIKYLGPSFATKHLYFMSPTTNQAPIIDSVVAGWLWRHGVASESSPLHVQDFDLHSYCRYLDFINRVLSEMDGAIGSRNDLKTTGFLEYLIFQDELRHRAVASLDPWNK